MITRVDWSTSGLTTPSGELDRPVAFGHWGVPEFVATTQEELVWGGIAARAVAPGPGLLEEFLKLSAEPADAIAKFARRWSVLGICSHGLPLTHNPPPRPFPEGTLPMTWCRPIPAGDDRFVEPLHVWRRYSRQFLATLNIAARLKAEQTGRVEDWRSLYYKIDRPVPWWSRTVDADWSLVCLIVNELLQLIGHQAVS